VHPRSSPSFKSAAASSPVNVQGRRMWWPPNKVRRVRALSRLLPSGYASFQSLRSCTHTPFPRKTISAADELHRVPTMLVQRGSAKQLSRRPQVKTSSMLIYPTLGSRRRMAGTSAGRGRGEETIATDVSKAEEGCPVTLVMTNECRARLSRGRASDDVILFEQGIHGSATSCSRP
jgi:hypothetical protein